MASYRPFMPNFGGSNGGGKEPIDTSEFATKKDIEDMVTTNDIDIDNLVYKDDLNNSKVFNVNWNIGNKAKSKVIADANLQNAKKIRFYVVDTKKPSRPWGWAEYDIEHSKNVNKLYLDIYSNVYINLDIDLAKNKFTVTGHRRYVTIQKIEVIY